MYIVIMVLCKFWMYVSLYTVHPSLAYALGCMEVNLLASHLLRRYKRQEALEKTFNDLELRNKTAQAQKMDELYGRAEESEGDSEK